MNRMMIAMLVLMLGGARSVMAMGIPEPQSVAARLYEARCSVCHALPHPKRLDWPAWQHTLRVMRERIQQRGMSEPSKQEWRQISGYLKRHAR